MQGVEGDLHGRRTLSGVCFVLYEPSVWPLSVEGMYTKTLVGSGGEDNQLDL
jgi:hypothetical protein